MMSKHMARAAAAAAFFGLSAGSAAALPPIGSDEYSYNWILAGYIGDMIDKNCDEISGRKLMAIQKLYQLRDRALKQGYSRDEVKAYFENREVRKDFTDTARRYLSQQGAKQGDKASYCAIGKREIAQGTLTGQLLRAN